MEFERMKRIYILGALIVWVGMYAAALFLFYDTTFLYEVLMILFPGAVYFLIIVPGGLFQEQETEAV